MILNPKPENQKLNPEAESWDHTGFRTTKPCPLLGFPTAVGQLQSHRGCEQLRPGNGEFGSGALRMSGFGLGRLGDFGV